MSEQDSQPPLISSIQTTNTKPPGELATILDGPLGAFFDSDLLALAAAENDFTLSDEASFIISTINDTALPVNVRLAAQKQWRALLKEVEEHRRSSIPQVTISQSEVQEIDGRRIERRVEATGTLAEAVAEIQKTQRQQDSPATKHYRQNFIPPKKDLHNDSPQEEDHEDEIASEAEFFGIKTPPPDVPDQGRDS